MNIFLDIRANTCIETVTAKQIEIFTYGCPNLKHLKIGYFFDHNYSKLFQCLGKNNPLLESLNLSSDYLREIQEDITSTSLECLSKGCPLLQQLYLSYVDLPKEGLASLVKNSINLENIQFESCKILPDGFTEIEKFKTLKTINFCFNDYLSDQNMANIVKNNPYLEDIGISNCFLLTDNSLFTIAANCPHLKRLDVDNCYDIDKFTDDGFWTLFHQCKQLVEICYDYNLPKELKDALEEKKMKLSV